ncbi:MAG: amidohydrolase family protein [Sphaerochaetaceae bacterium]|nr:amidohydrolase family protein [Sphaerochaetaceae bacterium]
MNTGKKADLIVLGNVITMDDRKPYARAVAIKGDRIIYVGSEDVARQLGDEKTKILDYGKNSVYPGFLEAHCHPGGAGRQAIGEILLKRDSSAEDCVQVLKNYIKKNPGKKMYSGAGFNFPEKLPDARMLDEVCPDIPVFFTSVDGHSMWLNTKAMEIMDINEEAVKKWGTSCVHVYDNGKPNGYISENPVFYVRSRVKMSVQEMKDYLLWWQNYSFSMGYTGIYDAGVELVSKNEHVALYEMDREGTLKQYVFSGSCVHDNTDTPEEDMDRIAEEAGKHNGKHYNVIGAKVFCDGVVEAHTAWMLDDYCDQPGYKGVSRFDDHDKMVRLLKAASKHGMNVHVHSIGDASTKAWVDAIAEAETATGNMDMRNALAHLHMVRQEDVGRFADYNIVAVAGIMWAEKEPGYFKQEVEYVGEKKASDGYRMREFVDAGAVIVSHSDFPVSPAISVPLAVCIGSQGYIPSHGIERRRSDHQFIGRKETLKALTVNVAYSWHAEDIMGSLEIGKLANMTVFDKDFMRDDFSEIEKARCLATIVDGELVYGTE